jgi:thiol-disulfide isomerase/thioredoxin
VKSLIKQTGGGWKLIFYYPPLFLLFCSTAPEIPLIPSNRVVLVEFFTWQRCVYCPYAAHTLDSLVSEFADSVAVIAYHRRVAGDTLSPQYVEHRRALYYESGGEPAVVFDGGEVVRTPGPEYNYETYKNYILGARRIRPQAQLTATAYLNSTAGRITIHAWGVDSTPSETLQLFAVITEDHIREHLSGATDSVYNDVMRAILPESTGKPIRLSRAETLTVEIEFQAQPAWQLDNLNLIAFIQQPSTRKVLQTVKCPVNRR